MKAAYFEFEAKDDQPRILEAKLNPNSSNSS